MVCRALNLIRGQSEELRSHIGEFQRQLPAGAAPSTGAATGHDPTHEPGHGGLDPGEHVGGSSRRGVRRPVRGAAASFPRIPPQLGRAGRRQTRRRRRGGGGEPQMVNASFIQRGTMVKSARMARVKPCTLPRRAITSLLPPS